MIALERIPRAMRHRVDLGSQCRSRRACAGPRLPVGRLRLGIATRLGVVAIRWSPVFVVLVIFVVFNAAAA